MILTQSAYNLSPNRKACTKAISCIRGPDVVISPIWYLDTFPYTRFGYSYITCSIGHVRCSSTVTVPGIPLPVARLVGMVVGP